MAKLGEVLRAQRERKGVTLDQAADDTRIREKFLAALEAGDYRSLPGAVYTKGFLRNYAEYLGLGGDELVALFQSERGGAEPQRHFQPIRPIMRRTVILTPAVLVPIVVLAAVALFVGYLYYQFTSFAVPPRLDLAEPADDVVSRSAEILVRGFADPDGVVTIRVNPGAETVGNIRPDADGAFAAAAPLKPGANHLEVEVLSGGKVSRVTRTVRYETAVAPPPAEGPPLALSEPVNGSAYTNAAVPVSGRTGPSVTELLVNGDPVPLGPEGAFALSVSYPAGTHAVAVTARTPNGDITESRSVSVAFTAAVVVLRIEGGEAWILAVVDGADVPDTGRILPEGTARTFTGREVRIRTGNAGVTFVVHNGVAVGRLGEVGQIVERTFTFQ
ncbi:MAG TPA: helix-turn-helix domain-containing protein [Candidatus Limnocylindrales bacterium]|nr:helix-turn-helix domain-containing protein [Candidatus Limnocylindrales bacterium]